MSCFFGGLWRWVFEANYLPNKTAKIICLINSLTLLNYIPAINSLHYAFLCHLQGFCLPYLPIYLLLLFEGLKSHVLQGFKILVMHWELSPTKKALHHCKAFRSSIKCRAKNLHSLIRGCSIRSIPLRSFH